MTTYQTVINWHVSESDNRNVADIVARIVENHLREVVAFAYDTTITVDNVKTVDPSFHF